MLLRITNNCTMECSHCMVNALPTGKHASIETVIKALEFNGTYDRTILIISGGEPTNHPEFLNILELLTEYNNKLGKVLILSNGLFLYDIDYREKILKAGIEFQITNDKRYYPKPIMKVNHHLLTYEYSIRNVSPFGRAIKNSLSTDNKAPLCFNFRSCMSKRDNFKDALLTLRMHKNFCTPSINIDGSIVMGETPFCHVIGNIYDKPEILYKNAINASCDRCKLSRNLTELHLAYWKLLEANLL